MSDRVDSFPVLYSLGTQAGVVDISHAVYEANTNISTIFNQLIPEQSHATKRTTAQSLKGGCMTADP